MRLLIHKETLDHTPLLLTEQEGEELREMIVKQITCSFSFYVNNILHMHASNVHNYLTGRKPITINNLRKLLSGTKLEISECFLQLTVEKAAGKPAQDADFIPLEEMLSCPESDLLGQDTESEPYSLEKHPGPKKIVLGRPSSAPRVESSTSSSPDSPPQ